MHYLGQKTASEEDRERVAARVLVMALQNLTGAVFQKVMQAVGSPVPVQALAIVPDNVKAQNLDVMIRNHCFRSILVRGMLYVC